MAKSYYIIGTAAAVCFGLVAIAFSSTIYLLNDISHFYNDAQSELVEFKDIANNVWEYMTHDSTPEELREAEQFERQRQERFKRQYEENNYGRDDDEDYREVGPPSSRPRRPEPPTMPRIIQESPAGFRAPTTSRPKERTEYQARSNNPNGSYDETNSGSRGSVRGDGTNPRQQNQLRPNQGQYNSEMPQQGRSYTPGPTRNDIKQDHPESMRTEMKQSNPGQMRNGMRQEHPNYPRPSTRIPQSSSSSSEEEEPDMHPQQPVNRNFPQTPNRPQANQCGVCSSQVNKCPPGPPGPRGRPGPPGFPGQDGPSGLRGLNAISTPTASQYDDEIGCIQCPIGPPGPPGKIGNPGFPGPDGKDGEPGAHGKDGEPGAPGAPGDRGTNGTPGAPGKPGNPGKDGASCKSMPGPPGEPGAPGEAGRPGDPGIDGEHGQPGSPGIQGPPGRDGQPGQDGQPGVSIPGAPGADGGYCPCPKRATSMEALQKVIEMYEKEVAAMKEKAQTTEAPQEGSSGGDLEKAESYGFQAPPKRLHHKKTEEPTTIAPQRVSLENQYSTDNNEPLAAPKRIDINVAEKQQQQTSRTANYVPDEQLPVDGDEEDPKPPSIKFHRKKSRAYENQAYNADEVGHGANELPKNNRVTITYHKKDERPYESDAEVVTTDYNSNKEQQPQRASEWIPMEQTMNQNPTIYSDSEDKTDPEVQKTTEPASDYINMTPQYQENDEANRRPSSPYRRKNRHAHRHRYEKYTQ